MQFKIGRDPSSDVVIEDISISKTHAMITIQYYDDIEIEDQGSTNGTFINNRKIKKSKLLAGDQIKFGSFEPKMERFLEDIFDKYKKSKTDFSREFLEIMSIFKVYQHKKDKLINQPKGPLVFKILITLGVIIILNLYPNIIPNDGFRFLLMTSIGMIGVMLSAFGPSQSQKQQKLDILRRDFEDKLICPKCKTRLINNHYSYYEGRKKCINERCDAIYI